MRVATWNLWAMGGDRRRRLDTAADLIDGRDADICCLQETFRSATIDVAGELAVRTARHLAVEQSRSRWWEGRLGQGVAVANAILSRWPVLGQWLVALPNCGGVDEGRSALFARIDAPDGPVLVVSTQLTSPPSASTIRCAQVRAVAREVTTRRRPADTVVVAGDLNAEPDSDEVRLLCGHKTAPAAAGLVLVDVWRYAPSADPGWTWQRENPHVRVTGEPSSRIDYILAAPLPSGRLPDVTTVATFANGPEDGVWTSDHAGVCVDFGDPSAVR